jgi:hypothetical protein
MVFKFSVFFRFLIFSQDLLGNASEAILAVPNGYWQLFGKCLQSISDLFSNATEQQIHCEKNAQIKVKT